MKEEEIKVWNLNNNHRPSCSAYVNINNEEFFASLVKIMDSEVEIRIFPSKNEKVTNSLEVIL